ncbi:choice-of-anchor Q domain-containing protein [Pseudomonadota bacterium]
MLNKSIPFKFAFLFLLFLALLAATFQSALAQNIYTVCPPPGDCTYPSPEAGINDPALDEITGPFYFDVTPGTYVLSETLQVDKEIIVQGNGSVFDANGLRAIEVYSAPPLIGNLSLNDLTIRNGQATAGNGGGAILVSGGATLTVTGGIFENNQAEFGGAIHNNGSMVDISESVLSGNRATAGEGGAIWTSGGGTTELTGVEVDGNVASLVGGGLAVGGGSSHLEILESTISNNTAVAASLDQSNDTLTTTTTSCVNGVSATQGQTFVPSVEVLTAFELKVRQGGTDGGTPPAPGTVLYGRVRDQVGNVIATATAIWPGFDGGSGFLHYELDVPVIVWSGNIYSIEIDTTGGLVFSIYTTEGSDPYPAGSSYKSCGVLTPNDDYDFKTFGGTRGDGAGIHAEANSDVRLDTSTVSGNLGDGIFVADSTLESVFSTIAWNWGNGFTSVDVGGTSAGGTFSSTLISGNGGNDCESLNFVSLGYNLIEDNTGCSITPAIGDQIGTSANPINAVLAALSNNGGITSTHAFGPGTPAVDAAGTGCSGNLDQRGVSRPKGIACDIGAFESVPLLQRMIDTTPAGDILIVPDGTYQELIIIGDNKGLRGSSPDNVVIDASAISIPGSVITATGDFTLEGIRVTGGSSPDNGGGIYADIPGTDIILRDVVLDDNDAASGGGAVYLQDGTLDGTNVLFANNHAIDGGAIHNEGSIVTISESVFSGNSASDGQGSAILTQSGGSTTLIKTTVDNNSSILGGGVLAVVDPDSVLNVFSSTVSNNNSELGVVSGIQVSDGAEAWLDTSTVSGNEGFGIVVEPGEVADPASFMKATFCTIAENQNGFYAVTGSTVEFDSSIIAGSVFNDCNGNGTITSLGYNLLGREDNCVFTPSTGDVIGTEVAINPLLGELQDNGGFTLTHAIGSDSPAFNAGGTGCIEDQDQRGVGRPIGFACDIGAYEADAVPLEVGPVTLRVRNLDQDLEGYSESYPGVVDVPIIEIPIEKLTGDTFNSPESAPLGSFPIGSFPIGSFDLRNSPIGSFPIGSFPIGSFPIGSFPLGSFPLSSIPLLSAGGWADILIGTDLEDAPLQTVTLEQVLRLNPVPDSVADIELRDMAIQGSPLASLSLPGLSLGTTTVDDLDDWISNTGKTDTVCTSLTNKDPSFTGCDDADTLLGLEMAGAPVSALSLSSLPLGSFPIGSFPIGSFPIGSFPLGSFPIGSFPIGSFPIGSFPIGSFPIGSFPIGSFNLLAAPIGSFPIGSFPIGSFPIGSFEIDGKSFCEFFDEQTPSDTSDTCGQLGLDTTTAKLADVLQALANNGASNLGSTPLGSFPIGSFPIGSFPIGSFDMNALSAPPISELTLGDFDGCTKIADNSTDTCSTLLLNDSSTLWDVAHAYGDSLAASPLGSFPIGSFNVANLPMGSFPIGSFEVNGTPIGSFPLGSFDLINSPIGSFPLGSFSSLTTIIDGVCNDCQTLADAAKAGVINASATLADLALSSEFATTTLGEVLDAMTLAILYGPGTLANIENTGNLTLGQLLIAMMLKTDFPWETIPLTQLDAQEFSADNLVSYFVDIPLTGTESEQLSVAVTIPDSFLYVKGSAVLEVEFDVEFVQSEQLEDPIISSNEDGTQTLTFNPVMEGDTYNTISFTAVPAMVLGDYAASARVTLGTDDPVIADNAGSTLTIIPHWFTDVNSPIYAPTSPADVLLLGFIDTSDDKDYFKVAPPAEGDRVAVFMSNPASDNDLVMYEPLSTIEAKGQTTEAAALDSVPFEDDGVDYEGNLTEEPNALEDVNLDSTTLASISTNRDDADESVSAVAGNTDPFIIQVSGYNGAISDEPYTLRVKVTAEVPVPQCTARSWPDMASNVAPAGSWTPDTNAVFLVNGSRLASSDPDGIAGADAALTAINSLINAPGITDGVVIDVADILVELGVANYYGDWDDNPCDADAANAIVNAITQYLEEKRLISPNLAYVTIVGSDEVIPFARKPDETSIANESTFAGEFSDNAMYGSLVTRHFLSDDTYGDIDPIAWLDRYLNVPELGVGRLVESAEDIQTAATNYIDSAGLLDPQTALSAGYDFIADASQDIDDTFNEYGPVLGFSVASSLIDQPGVDPNNAWSRTDFLTATGLNTTTPLDMVSFNMHFDFDEALPSKGDATGDYKNNLIKTTDLGTTDLDGGIWFTVGCHSGTSVADVSVIGGAPKQDWAQSFSHLGALYLAQNAYGLGDTEAIALTERLMANFARNLDGNLTIGQAHALAKQQYFANLGLYGEYDFKALQAATLFGLPMYQYGGGAIISDPPAALPVSTDPLSGLSSASWSLADTGITETVTSKGDLFSVAGETQFVHFRPLQPIVRRDVTGPGGEIASGAFLTSLVTEDKAVSDIAFARPVIARADIEPEVETDEVVFPTAFTNIASFKAPPPTGGPFAPRQQLNVIVGQFTSPPDGGSSGTERLFRSFDAQVFYRPSADDFIRPEFDNVQANVVGSSPAQQAAFSVDVFDEGDVLRVAVLYLQSITNGKGNWVLANLVKGASNSAGGHTWTGGGPVDLSGVTDGQVDYMVQAVDANGNVANSTFKGLFYVAEELPAAPDGGSGSIGVILTAGGEVVSNPADWITVDPVHVEVTNQAQGTSYKYSIDSAAFVSLTAEGFQVVGDGVHIVTVQESDGSNPVTFAVLIDTAPIEIVGPVNPVAIGEQVTVTITATDLEGVTEKATIFWGDGTTSTSSSLAPDTITQDGELFTAMHVYTEPGMYPIAVAIEYDNGEPIKTGVFKYAIVFDSNGGFVTGGGWINSPSGAYTPDNDGDPDITGKANINLNLKYQNGRSVPEGSNKFRFNAGGLDFRATTYDWLVISGAHAYFQGEGKLKGDSESYKFLITALDADVSGAGVGEDSFGIRIWQESAGGTETVLYDNSSGSGETTALGGGSITIHKAETAGNPKKPKKK